MKAKHTANAPTHTSQVDLIQYCGHSPNSVCDVHDGCNREAATRMPMGRGHVEISQTGFPHAHTLFHHTLLYVQFGNPQDRVLEVVLFRERPDPDIVGPRAWTGELQVRIHALARVVVT